MNTVPGRPSYYTELDRLYERISGAIHDQGLAESNAEHAEAVRDEHTAWTAAGVLLREEAGDLHPLVWLALKRTILAAGKDVSESRRARLAGETTFAAAGHQYAVRAVGPAGPTTTQVAAAILTPDSPELPEQRQPRVWLAGDADAANEPNPPIRFRLDDKPDVWIVGADGGYGTPEMADWECCIYSWRYVVGNCAEDQITEVLDFDDAPGGAS